MLLASILRHTAKHPQQLAMSLPWIPRVLELFEILEADPPDVLHLFWGNYPALLARLVQERLPEVRVSLSLAAHDLLAEYGCTRPVAARADVVRTIARANVPATLAMGAREDTLLVARRGIDLTRVAADDRDGEGGPRIVVASRLIPDKGIDDALRAFAIAQDAHPRSRLSVCGEGPDRARLERLLRALGLPTSVREHLDSRALSLLEADKKRRGESIDFVFAGQPGQSRVAPISIQTLRSLLRAAFIDR